MPDLVDQLFERVPIAKPVALPGGYPPGLFDGDLDEVVRHLALGARELLRKHRTVPCTAYVFARRDPTTGKPGDALFTTAIEGDYTDALKDLFAGIVRTYVDLGEARGVAFLTEAWALDRKEGPRPEGSIANEPDRQEIVFAMLETPTSQRSWIASLTRYGRRGVHLGDFVNTGRPRLEGRFAGMFKPPAAREGRA